MEKVNILIVTDTQNDFESGSLGTAQAQATVGNIVNKIEECGDAGYIILNTKDTHDENYLNTNEGRHLAVVHTIKGTPGWAVVDKIRKALNKYDVIDVLKDRFGSIDLSGVVRVLASQALGRVVTDGRGVNITIIGWCTDICVITNALLLKTMLPEADITVDSSCCAGVTPESHDAALIVMKSCQINVV